MNKREVRTIQAMNTYPSISILMPTHRTAPDNRQDPIRLKNLITETLNRLTQEFSGRNIAPYADKLNAIYETIDFQNTLDGLALYISDQYVGVFLLPFSIKERVVIDNTFALVTLCMLSIASRAIGYSPLAKSPHAYLWGQKTHSKKFKPQISP